MSESTTRQAIDVIEALATIGEYLDMTPGNVAGMVCFFDDVKTGKIETAYKQYSEFYDSDVVTRGKMLGIEITVSENNDAR